MFSFQYSSGLISDLHDLVNETILVSPLVTRGHNMRFLWVQILASQHFSIYSVFEAEKKGKTFTPINMINVRCRNQDQWLWRCSTISRVMGSIYSMQSTVVIFLLLLSVLTFRHKVIATNIDHAAEIGIKISRQH